MKTIMCSVPMTDNRHSFAKKNYYYFRKQGKWQFQINFLKNSNN